MEIFVLGILVFSEIEMVMINSQQDFLSSNSVCNHTRDYQSDRGNHSYDSRSNWTPHGPSTIINK